MEGINSSSWESPSELVRRCCSEANIHIDQLLGPSHAPHIVQVRARAVLELRERGLSLPRIGLMLNRHHTSILSMLAKSRARMAQEAAQEGRSAIGEARKVSTVRTPSGDASTAKGVKKL